MTTVDFILIVFAILVILAGLYLVVRSLKHRRNKADNEQVEYDKNGIPIIPRHERNLIDEPDFDDTLAGETTITPSREYLSAVIEEDEPNTVTHHTGSLAQQDAEFDHTQPTASQSSNITAFSKTWQDNSTENTASSHPSSHPSTQQSTSQTLNQTDEHDAFSSLVSATEHLMPVIDTADEPEFTDNSPVLDQHLSAAADHDQHSPLNNAQANINLTILPEDFALHSFTKFSGEQLLNLAEKFGLKYGTMNMFHRYENKDGTGILWFSMMGIGDDDIAPFDLNIMPHTTYRGLVLFLSLPHPKALAGFDSMVSIAGLMARELNAVVLDEKDEPLTPAEKNRLRMEIQNDWM